MSEKINRVLDCVGREWHVTEAAVREDYIEFLMDADGLSRAAAEQEADSKEGNGAWQYGGYWFAQQIADSPRHVRAIGALVKDISTAEKEKLVNYVANNGALEILDSADINTPKD